MRSIHILSVLAAALCCAGTSAAAPVFVERFDSAAATGPSGSFAVLHDNRHTDLTPNTYFDVQAGQLRLAQQDMVGPNAVGTRQKFTLGPDGGMAVRLTTAPGLNPLPPEDLLPTTTNENRRFLFSLFFTDGFGLSSSDPDIGPRDPITDLSSRDPGFRFEIGLRAGVRASAASPGDAPSPAPIEVFGRGTGVTDASVVTTSRPIAYGEQIVLAASVSGGALTLSVYDTSLTLLGQTVVADMPTSGAYSFADEPDGRLVFSQSAGRHVQFVTIDEVVLTSDSNPTAALSVIPLPQLAGLMGVAVISIMRRRWR